MASWLPSGLHASAETGPRPGGAIGRYARRVDLRQHHKTVGETARHHLLLRMRRDARAGDAVATGELDRRLAHRAAAEERPKHHGVRAAGGEPLAVAGERQRLSLGGIAAHAHVLVVGEPPAMQRVLLHRGHHRIAVGMDGDRSVAALPFQPARAVHLGCHKPKRGAVVVRCRDTLAAAVEGKAGDGGGMRELLELLPGVVEQVDGFADCAGQQSLALLAGMSGDVLHPFRAEVGDHRADAAEFSIIATGDEARGGGVGRQREDGAIMCLDRAPGVAIGNVDEAKRAVAEGEGKCGPGAVEARGHNEGIEFVLGAAGTRAGIWRRIRSSCSSPSPQLPPARGGGAFGSLGGGGRATHRINQRHNPRTRAAAAACSGCAR